jgi:hypothetical protein
MRSRRSAGKVGAGQNLRYTRQTLWPLPQRPQQNQTFLRLLIHLPPACEREGLPALPETKRYLTSSLRGAVVCDETIPPVPSLRGTKQSRLNKCRNTTNNENTLVDLDCFVPRNDGKDKNLYPPAPSRVSYTPSTWRPLPLINGGLCRRAN